eukprot:CAMPEP_0119003042 /NCGR_PEP_ID=MMETSP1176-20130426/318_1 /TAXON_ID=265551 /ORGANISM="Synedropsis recta cf, Strain CCMP1620" /LENGTH=304 /DNA_ID=CAMNT_0006954601 /DNA_START=92 /DNA_END=1006 /DNA_ORIENTATION=+
MALLRISIWSLLFVQAAAFSVLASSLPRAVVTAAKTRDVSSARCSKDNDDDDDDYFGENDEDDDYFGENDDNGDSYFGDDPPRQQRRQPEYDDLGEEKEGFSIPSPFGRRSGFRLPESVSNAVLAGIFVLGMGTGVTLDSSINTDPKDLASRDAIDQAAPNANLCASYGASALALDQRVFVSFNPFNVYVAQADVKPACVLQQSNVVSVLKDRKLINANEVRACKQNMNTWAFVGDLEDQPQLSCVYKSEDAQNEFLDNPKLGIGEDVWDDDRAKAQGKLIKGALTKAQQDAVRRQGINVPGVD